MDEPLARHSIAAGARFVAVGVEATMLARAARDLAAGYRRAGDGPGAGETSAL